MNIKNTTFLKVLWSINRTNGTHDISVCRNNFNILLSGLNLLILMCAVGLISHMDNTFSWKSTDSVVISLIIKTKSEDISKILKFVPAWMFHIYCAMSISCQDMTQMNIN